MVKSLRMENNTRLLPGDALTDETKGEEVDPYLQAEDLMTLTGFKVSKHASLLHLPPQPPPNPHPHTGTHPAARVPFFTNKRFVVPEHRLPFSLCVVVRRHGTDAGYAATPTDHLRSRRLWPRRQRCKAKRWD